jgi:hypothetical protein
VGAIGIRVSEDTDLVITQPGEIVGARLDADRDGNIMYFLRRQHVGRIDLPGIQNLAT